MSLHDAPGSLAASQLAWARDRIDNPVPWSDLGANSGDVSAFSSLRGRALPIMSAQQIATTGSAASTRVEVALPSLNAIPAAACPAGDHIKQWIADELVPAAVTHWETTFSLHERAIRSVDALQAHKTAKTFPQAVLSAVREFTVSKDGEEVSNEDTRLRNQLAADQLIAETRTSMLEIALKFKESEMNSTNYIVQDEWVTRTLLSQWESALEPLAEAAPGLQPIQARPLFHAALTDLQHHFVGRKFARATAAKKAASLKAAKDLAAANSRMDVDVATTDSTLEEKIERVVKEHLKLANKASIQPQPSKPANVSARRSRVFRFQSLARLSSSSTHAESISSAEVEGFQQQEQVPAFPRRQSLVLEGRRERRRFLGDRPQEVESPQHLQLEPRTRKRKLLREIDERSILQPRRKGRRIDKPVQARSDDADWLGAGSEEAEEMNWGFSSDKQWIASSEIDEKCLVRIVIQNPRDQLRAVDVAKGERFHIARADTYPPEFWQLSKLQKIRFVILHSSCLWLETKMDPPKLLNPHALVVPREIARLLAMNVKFIQRPKFDLENTKTGLDKLTKDVRTRYTFLDQPANDGFVFKFHIPSGKPWAPEKAHRTLEYGLKIGRAAIEDALAHVDPSQWRPNFSSHTVKSLQQLITRENDILVKPADKNLGLVLLRKSWYINEGLRQLADASTYQIVPEPGSVIETLVSYRAQLVQYFVEDKFHEKRFTAQLQRFLVHPPEEELAFPEFHHLPKVHKSSLAGRPIVPSHSWVTSNCSVYLDTLLQPMIRDTPWILRDSKTLLRELAQVEMPTCGEQVWVVTADISSMYTNIPTEKGIKSIAELARTFYEATASGSLEERRHEGDKMSELVEWLASFVLKHSYLSFQGQVYKQIQGTAMGTACAPTYANLFVAALEGASLCNETHRPDWLLYYTRYIDDVLAIVKGPRANVDKLIDRLNALAPGVLVFIAEASDTAVPFLDALIMLEPNPLSPANRTLETRVYQKPLNSYQYIPWSSYHPDSVKRSFVKGELLRYVRLSSRFRDYQEVAALLWKRLRARGYPIRWLRNAFAEVKYKASRPSALIDRIKPEDRRAPLVFHVMYNPVYDQVNLGKALTHTAKHFDPALRAKIVGPSGRIIRCAHRAPNFSDMINTLNKRALATDSSSSETAVSITP